MKKILPKVIFFGTPEFSIPSLTALIERNFPLELVITRPDRKRGRGQRLSAPPVKEQALAKGLKCYQPESLKRPDVIDELAKYEPDCLVVVAYGQLIPREVIEIAPLGAVNVHPSLLPKYRGAAPIQRAIMAGEKITGVTIMLLDEGMDSGPILSQEKVEIGVDDTLGILHDKLAKKGAELLVNTLESYYVGEVSPKSQIHSEATFAPAIKKEECLIDWLQDASSISNLIRAIDPIPGAYTYWEGKILKVFKPRVERIELQKTPGEVVEAAPHGLLVATGDGGGVRIREVQLAGQRRMTFAEFARGKGKKLISGTILGGA